MVRKELSEQTKQAIRAWREKECFPYVDRAAWYDALPAHRKKEVQKWRKACLDATKTGVCPARPKWIK